jgi:hypothetical protein
MLGRWGAGLLAVAALGVAACGDSGSAARQAAGVSGPSVTSGESIVLAKKKGSGNGSHGNGNGNNGNGNGGSNRGAGGGGGDAGGHRGRPEAELRGPVAGKAGRCPSITFSVNEVAVRANGVTAFEGTSCARLADGQVVVVEGQPLGNGMVLARHVQVVTGGGGVPDAPAARVRVLLVSDGAVAASQMTGASGHFEFEDTAPGVYELQATVPGSSGCPVTLTTGISLTAQQNEVEGRVARTGAATACGTLILAELEVHQGNR